MLQGSFHPARKVCEVHLLYGTGFLNADESIIWAQVYWHVYNSQYLGAADALVPFYPDLGEPSEGQNVYDRHPLQMFV